MKVVFRADASVKMGSGHVMRCLTLAGALKENGADVIFISRAHDGNLNQLIIRKGFHVIELPKPTGADIGQVSTNGDDFNDWLGVVEEQDAKETTEAIRDKQIDWIIIDHYSLGIKWEKSLRSYVSKIMVIDDLENRKHDCDLLLDQNYNSRDRNRYSGLVPEYCKKLLGPGFALLRNEFTKARQKRRIRSGKVGRIFVFFSGLDHDGLTAKALEALQAPELINLRIDVVITSTNAQIDKLYKVIKYRDKSSLHIQINNIAELMLKADLAICAGGSSTWERLYVGLPSLVVTVAENQIPSTRDLQNDQFLRWLGTSKNINVNDLTKYIIKGLSDTNRNRKESEMGIQLVDGNGTHKVVNAILDI